MSKKLDINVLACGCGRAFVVAEGKSEAFRNVKVNKKIKEESAAFAAKVSKKIKNDI